MRYFTHRSWYITRFSKNFWMSIVKSPFLSFMFCRKFPTLILCELMPVQLFPKFSFPAYSEVREGMRAQGLRVDHHMLLSFLKLFLKLFFYHFSIKKRCIMLL